MHSWTKENRDKVIVWLLWLLVGVGILVRLVNPFFSNPLDFLLSDPLRHYFSAKECLRSDSQLYTVLEIMDPLGYQIWLSAILRITGGDRPAIALYTGLLSIITPWLWYRWMRLCISDKRLALVGYAVLSLLPDWIRLYQFFLQETLLLPLVGLSLWLSWRAFENPSLRRYVSLGFAWGCALLTKITALPMAAVVFAWMFWKSASDKPQRRMSIIAVAIALAIYALGPFKIYNRIHAIVLIPPGDYHRIWYESGRDQFRYTIRFVDNQQGYHQYVCDVGNPTLDLQLEPFINWKTSRTGTCELLIDYTKSPGNYISASHMSLADRLKYTGENIMFFFFGLSWPEDHVLKDAQLGVFQNLMKSVRFIWLPITLTIVFLAIKKRRYDIMTALFAVTLLFFTLQQSIILEARYKKPWEGIAIATLLSLLSSRSKTLDRRNVSAEEIAEVRLDELEAS